MTTKTKAKERKEQRVPVTLRAVTQRINRRHRSEWDGTEHGEWLILRASRGAAAYREFGAFYLLEACRNVVRRRQYDVDPETHARDLGVLKPHEYLQWPTA